MGFDGLLTVGGTARRLDVDRATVRKWARNGRMGVAQQVDVPGIGTMLYFDPAEVERVAALPRSKAGRPRKSEAA